MPVDPLPVFVRAVEDELRAIIRALEGLLVKLDDWRADVGEDEREPPGGGSLVRPYPDEEARSEQPQSNDVERTWLCPYGCELPRHPHIDELRHPCGAAVAATPETCHYRPKEGP